MLLYEGTARTTYLGRKNFNVEAIIVSTNIVDAKKSFILNKVKGNALQFVEIKPLNKDLILDLGGKR